MKTTVPDLKHSLMAVVRSDSTDEARNICKTLASGGVRLLEIAVNNEHGAEAIARVAEESAQGKEGVRVGAGSVLNEKSARAACESGAAFLVSPGYSERVHAVATNRNVLYVPGVLTPAEIMRCVDQGLELLKLFPAGLHGPDYLKDLFAPFPHVKLMPTGGVDLTNMGAFFQAGAWCVGVGGSLLKKRLIEEERWDELENLARQYSAALKKSVS